MPHIFISYAKKDTRELAQKLNEHLNQIHGLSTWFDESNLSGGDDWELKIEAEIDKCDVLLVLCSPDISRHRKGEKPSYVLKEISYAQHTGKRIIPVMVQDIKVPISIINLQRIYFNEFDDLMLKITTQFGVTFAPSLVNPNTLTYDQQIELARNFKGRKNSDWTPIFRTFTVKGIDFEMCLVPVGSFMMGNEDGYGDEKPVHRQTVAEPYWIGVHPVTNAQWRQAVRAGGAKVPSWSDWYDDNSKNNHPVVGVTWYQCRDFVQWLGDDWQLPTEPRWEYAARGLDNLIYPFGNDFVPDLVVYVENSNGSTAVIGGRAKGISWVGAQDMSGNVLEWQLSEYRGAYPYVADDGRENISSDKSRVLRGGSFYGTSISLRSTRRHSNYLEGDNADFGFRLCHSITL